MEASCRKPSRSGGNGRGQEEAQRAYDSIEKTGKRAAGPGQAEPQALIQEAKRAADDTVERAAPAAGQQAKNPAESNLSGGR